jgi:hypothetical protein
MSSDGDKKAKRFKQAHLGELGKGSITQSLFNSSGRKVAEVPIAEGAKPVASANFACSGCGRSFVTPQGKASHERWCRAAIQAKESIDDKFRRPQLFAVAAPDPSRPPNLPTAREAKLADKQASKKMALIRMPECQPKEAKEDGRKNNRESAIRDSYTAACKYHHLMHLDQWLATEEDGPPKSVSSYVILFH